MSVILYFMVEGFHCRVETFSLQTEHVGIYGLSLDRSISGVERLAG